MDVFSIIVIASGVAVVVLLGCGNRKPRPVTSRSSSGSARVREKVSAEDRTPAFALSVPCDIFHTDQSVIWSTQVPVLRFVLDREPRGSYYTPLKLIHIELARRYPELYDGHTFQEWVEFLIRMGVFHFEDDAIHLTQFGREVLEFLEAAMRRQTTEAVSVPGRR